MKGDTNKQETERGFTLVELLTVVAIIGILAALVLSTLDKAKKSAHKVVCINNLKQIQTTWILYYEDNDGKLVLNAYMGGYPPTIAGNSLKFAPSWVNGVMAHTNLPWQSEWYFHASTNVEYLVDSKYALFAPYIRAASIYKCPTDRSTVPVGTGRYRRVRSYSMNTFLGNTNGRLEYGTWRDSNPDFVDWRPGAPMRFNTVRHLQSINTTIFCLIDEHEDTILDPVFEQGVAWSPDQTSWLALPASRHGNAGTLSFVDGHVEVHKWVDSRTRKPVDGQHPEVRRPCPNNPDVLWLSDRTTEFFLYKPY